MSRFLRNPNPRITTKLVPSNHSVEGSGRTEAVTLVLVFAQIPTKGPQYGLIKFRERVKVPVFVSIPFKGEFDSGQDKTSDVYHPAPGPMRRYAEAVAEATSYTPGIGPGTVSKILMVRL